jgi:hypothetical protein
MSGFGIISVRGSPSAYPEIDSFLQDSVAEDEPLIEDVAGQSVETDLIVVRAHEVTEPIAKTARDLRAGQLHLESPRAARVAASAT